MTDKHPQPPPHTVHDDRSTVAQPKPSPLAAPYDPNATAHSVHVVNPEDSRTFCPACRLPPHTCTTHENRWVAKPFDLYANVPPYVPDPPPRDTLAEAKDALFLTLSKGEGIQCPCCEQYARVWRRVLGRTIAGPLKDIYERAASQRAEYKVAGDDGPRTAVDVVIGYVDVRQFHYRGGDYSKSQFWNLLQAHPSRLNVFFLTELGVAFVEGRATVPRYCMIFNDSVVGFSDERTDIQTALGTEFSMDALKAEDGWRK